MVGVVYEVSLLRVQRLRLGELLENSPPKLSARPVDSGAISMEDVDYQYTEFEPWVLSNITLNVCAGEFVLVQGESGSGKSTLAKLILGLTSPTKGSILVDGCLLGDGMEGTASILQGDRLISDSIYNNIIFFRNDFLESDVVAAAKAAEIYDFVQSMPMRFHTPISDDFAGLSAGQRQRILLARAFLAKPKLFVLDEATNHLDVETESKILQKLRSMPGTKIVISHRPDVMSFADRVLSMQSGRVVNFQTRREHL